jgi:hypothetical protein
LPKDSRILSDVKPEIRQIELSQLRDEEVEVDNGLSARVGCAMLLLIGLVVTVSMFPTHRMGALIAGMCALSVCLRMLVNKFLQSRR